MMSQKKISQNSGGANQQRDISPIETLNRFQHQKSGEIDDEKPYDIQV